MRAAIYCRVSSDPKLTSRSVEEQEAECRLVCEREGWTVAEVFVDNDLSASRFATKDRPAYKQLAEFLRGGGAGVLVLWEASRAQRDLTDYVRLRDLCEGHGVLYSYSGKTYDLSRTDDRFATGLDALLAERESGMTRDRVLRAFRANVAAGKPHGKLLYGFIRQYDERGVFLKQVIHDEQADVVREAARRVSEGEACRSIAIDFNNRGIATPRREPLLRKAAKLRERLDTEDLIEAERERLSGEADKLQTEAEALRWDLTQIRRLVTNPAYAGHRVHQGAIAGPASWPSILDPDTYASCVIRMTDPRRKTQRDSSLKHLLSGAARCGVCGGYMRVQKNRSHFAYLCDDGFHVSVKTTNIEGFIADVIIERMSRPDVADLIQPAGTAAAAEKASEELARLEQRMEAFYSQAAEGQLSPVGLATIEKRLLPQIQELQKRVVPTPVPPPLREMAEGDAGAVWERFGIGVRRQVVELLMEIRVDPTGRGARTFDPGRVRIEWKTF